jgi:hypothetical protein
VAGRDPPDHPRRLSAPRNLCVGPQFVGARNTSSRYNLLWEYRTLLSGFELAQFEQFRSILMSCLLAGKSTSAMNSGSRDYGQGG